MALWCFVKPLINLVFNFLCLIWYSIVFLFSFNSAISNEALRKAYGQINMFECFVVFNWYVWIPLANWDHSLFAVHSTCHVFSLVPCELLFFQNSCQQTEVLLSEDKQYNRINKWHLFKHMNTNHAVKPMCCMFFNKVPALAFSTYLILLFEEWKQNLLAR